MRVIAGIAKGRHLKSIAGNKTRPTTDKVKESLFSILAPYLQGGNVLDLFAGTGGLGIEALSRGMDKAIFIDHNKQCVEIIKENIASCGFEEQVEIYRNDSNRALKVLLKREMSFDLIFLDPPYRLRNYEELITFFDDNRLVKSGGIVVGEHDVKDSLPDNIGSFQIIKHVNYGNIGISIYKNISD